MAQKRFNILNFLSKVSENLPPFLYIFGKDEEQRFVITMLLRSIAKTSEDSFVVESKDSKISPMELQDFLLYHELFGDKKVVYLQDYTKIKNLKKFSLEELRDLNGGSTLILDSYSEKLSKTDLDFLECNDIPILECVEEDKSGNGYKILVGIMINLTLGFKPRVDMLDLLCSRGLSLTNIHHILLAMDLKEDGLSRESFVPALAENYIKTTSKSDMDKFIYYVLTRNLRSALEYVDTSFYKEDKTTYILYYLSDIMEKLYSVKVRKNISHFEISSLLRMSYTQSKSLMDGSRRWSKFKIEEALRGMYKIDKLYTASSRSKISGKTQIDQLLLNILRD